MASPWTAAMDAEMRRLAGEGHSYGAIAAAMGLTKNQVVGRAHRLCLPARPSPIGQRQGAAPKAARRSARPSQAGQQQDAAPKPARLPKGSRTLPELSAPMAVLAAPQAAPMPAPHPFASRGCQFIAGEPAGASTEFCCAPVSAGSPYCPQHHALCHSKVPSWAA